MAENRSRTSVDRRRIRRAALASWIALAAFVLVGASTANAQPDSVQAGPTYQRKSSFAGHGNDHGGDWRRRQMPQFSSRTSAGSFQRPYPYHLDYYRAKWGGSYAPYFGNLYGPPNFFVSGFGGFIPFGFNGFNSFNSFNGFPGAGFDNQFGGFGGPGFSDGPGFQGGGSGWGGVPYGPGAGQFNGNMEMPVEGGQIP